MRMGGSRQLATVLALAAFVTGCGGSGGGPAPAHDAGSLDSGSLADASSTVQDASSDSGSRADAGATDSGAITIGLPGTPGQDIVSGGNRSTSPGFSLYSTVSEGPGSNGVMTSTHYKVIGGLVGTNSSP